MIGFEINGGRAEQVLFLAMIRCRQLGLDFHVRGPQSVTIVTFYSGEGGLLHEVGDALRKYVIRTATELGCNVEELPC